MNVHQQHLNLCYDLRTSLINCSTSSLKPAFYGFYASLFTKIVLQVKKSFTSKPVNLFYRLLPLFTGQNLQACYSHLATMVTRNLCPSFQNPVNTPATLSVTDPVVTTIHVSQGGKSIEKLKSQFTSQLSFLVLFSTKKLN